ncbi:MAG: hypothetical protein K2N16_04555, partial [Muribaculaceae bacterium]|nr:hypothetical protein [Muribaculaceae bacterium]
MKKHFNALAKAFTLVAACTIIISCGASQSSQTAYKQPNAAGSPFGEVYEAPHRIMIKTRISEPLSSLT